MEKSLDLIKDMFSLGDVDVRTHTPLALAFIGDCIFDLIIRSVIVSKYHKGVNDLHKKCVKIVKAQSQAIIMDALIEDLTEEEMSFYKRGRNAKSNTSAKNASIVAYRKATGLEALMGYLYLSNQIERAIELVKIGLERTEINI